MNYDNEIHHFYDPALNDKFKENDCAPYPFDMMVLFALYQNVPK